MRTGLDRLWTAFCRLRDGIATSILAWSVVQFAPVVRSQRFWGWRGDT